MKVLSVLVSFVFWLGFCYVVAKFFPEQYVAVFDYAYESIKEFVSSALANAGSTTV